MAELHPGRPTVAPADVVTPAPGTARRTGPGHVVSYGDGRICAAPGCRTQLSRYNGSRLCSARHQAFRALRIP